MRIQRYLSIHLDVRQELEGRTLCCYATQVDDEHGAPTYGIDHNTKRIHYSGVSEQRRSRARMGGSLSTEQQEPNSADKTMLDYKKEINQLRTLSVTSPD